MVCLVEAHARCGTWEEALIDGRGELARSPERGVVWDARRGRGVNGVPLGQGDGCVAEPLLKLNEGLAGLIKNRAAEAALQEVPAQVGSWCLRPTSGPPFPWLSHLQCRSLLKMSAVTTPPLLIVM